MESQRRQPEKKLQSRPNRLAQRGLCALLVVLTLSNAFAFEDPTHGEPFVPWLWRRQLSPTLQNAFSNEGKWVSGTTIAATVLAHQYDSDIYEHNRRGDRLFMDSKTSNFFGTLGGGGVGIGIVTLQLFWDQDNGIKHGRALLITSLNHVLFALAANRKRPDDRADYLPFDSAFPSGHAASIFATSASLHQAYGWKVGLPAHVLAIAISGARVSENTHWFSDIVAGAGLGAFWAIASYQMPDDPRLSSRETNKLIWTLPIILPTGGVLVGGRLEF
ncbi:MAG: phosphatase PAP2 family protein [Bdellovibrionaceae bacterium]|nr:phosphatase PAP2 family protein [Pseudobdellovibrionaceae bacterium]